MVRHCLSSWFSNGVEIDNCTTKDFHRDDITRPCALFAKELEFNKRLHTSLGTWANQTKYNLLDIDDLVNRQKAPLELVIKVPRKMLLRTISSI